MGRRLRLGYSPPEFSRARVGSESTTTVCNGANHTHFDIGASEEVDQFLEMKKNTEIPTWNWCAAHTTQEPTHGCGSKYNMPKPETPPRPRDGDGDSRLPLHAKHYQSSGGVWEQTHCEVLGEWVEDPCSLLKILEQ